MSRALAEAAEDRINRHACRRISGAGGLARQQSAAESREHLTHVFDVDSSVDVDVESPVVSPPIRSAAQAANYAQQIAAVDRLTAADVAG